MILYIHNTMFDYASECTSYIWCICVLSCMHKKNVAIYIAVHCQVPTKENNWTTFVAKMWPYVQGYM